MAKKPTLAFLTLALLLAIVGTAYYLYISKQESYFVDRNFRFLAFWSKELGKTVEDYKHHIQYIITVSSENRYEPDKFKKRLQDEFKKLNQKLGGKLFSFSTCSEFEILEQNRFIDDEPRIRAQLSSKDKDRLRLLYEREYEKEREKSKWAYKDTVQADLSISKVLPQLIASENFFDDVIVFDSETGTVHFQKNSSLYKIDDFRDIIVQRPDTGGLFSFFSDNSETTDERWLGKSEQGG